MPVLVVLVLLFRPAVALAGSAFAGMGGVGVGVPDSSGSLADNPAALSGVAPTEGVVHLGGAWQYRAFAGSVFNRGVTTSSNFPIAEGLSWSVVTPMIGNGRVAAGVWRLDRSVLELREELDLSLSHFPGGLPLVASYTDGVSFLKQDEFVNAIGAAWIQPVTGRNQQFSFGIAYVNLTGRGMVEAAATTNTDGNSLVLHRLATRRDQRGFAILGGYFFRPVSTGSLGVSIQYVSNLKGYVWEQVEGGDLYRDQVTRPAQLRVGVGGAFTILSNLTAAIDVKYVGGTDMTQRWFFAGTPASRYATEFSDSTISMHVGVEYRFRLARAEVPLRVGFFNQPDARPVQLAGMGATAVTNFKPVSFKQDVSGFSLGSGWEAGGVRADLALLWMTVNTYVKREVTGSEVDSGNARNTLGVVGSVSLKFGLH